MNSKSRKKVPITQHRLFPVIVALWFAALFGLGSFAVAPDMLGRAVAASGLPAVLPAAAPPLGFTARALVALILTGAGAIAGFVVGGGIARRGAFAAERRRVTPAVADAPKVRARDSHPDAPPRKPFTASEDMLPRPAEQPARRRALSVTDETVTPVSPEVAPLPGSREVEPLDLALLFAEPEGAEEVAEIVPEPLPGEAAAIAASEATPTEPASPAPATPVAAPEAASVLAPPEPAAIAPQPAPASRVPRSPLAAAPLESLGVVQLVERLALALSDYRERRPDGPLPQVLAAVLAGETPATPAPLPRLKPASPVAAVPEQPEKQPVVAMRPSPLTPPGTHNAEEAEAEMPLQATRFLRIETSSAADAAEEENFVPADAEDAIHAAEEHAAAPEAYSSLLDIASAIRPAPAAPFAQPPAADQPAPAAGPSPRQVFVRIDTPEDALPEAEPVVVFPGQAPRSLAPFDNPAALSGAVPAMLAAAPESTRPPEPAIDPEEADRALRAALATLQRMSGAR